MGMFDQENFGLDDPAAQKVAQRTASYRDQTDTPGYQAPQPPQQPERYDPDAGALVPASSNPAAVIGRGIGAVGGAIQSTFQQMGSTVGTGYAPPSAGPVIADSAQTPRVPGEQTRDTLQAAPYGMSDRGGATNPFVSQPDASAGPITQAVSAGPQGLGGTMSQYTPPPGTPTVQDYRNQLGQQELRDAFRQANDQRQLQERNYGQIAQGNAAQAGVDAERAAGAARVANWRASNGADMVLAASNPAYAKQRKVIADQAAAATTRADQLDTAAAKANAAVGQPLGNPIDDFFKSQEGLQRGQQGLATQQQGPLDAQLKAQHLDLGKYDLAAKKRIDDVSAQLGAEKDPKKIAQLHSTLLALLGKDKPEEYQVIHAPGATSVDPKTLTPIKEPDKVYIVNKRTAETQVLGGAAPAANAKQPLPEEIAHLKANPKLRPEFEKLYGNADQYLK